MSGRRQNKQLDVAVQLITAVVLVAAFACLGIWGMHADIGQTYKLLFAAALAAYSVLYIAAMMLLLRQIMGGKETARATTDENWFDRTMDLSNLPAPAAVSVEYEITAIHSDYIVT